MLRLLFRDVLQEKGDEWTRFGGELFVTLGMGLAKESYRFPGVPEADKVEVLAQHDRVVTVVVPDRENAERLAAIGAAKSKDHPFDAMDFSTTRREYDDPFPAVNQIFDGHSLDVNQRKSLPPPTGTWHISSKEQQLYTSQEFCPVLYFYCRLVDNVTVLIIANVKKILL